MVWVTLFNDAADALLSGDPDRAERLAAAALEIGTESGQPDAAGAAVVAAVLIPWLPAGLPVLIAALVAVAVGVTNWLGHRPTGATP